MANLILSMTQSSIVKTFFECSMNFYLQVNGVMQSRDRVVHRVND